MPPAAVTNFTALDWTIVAAYLLVSVALALILMLACSLLLPDKNRRPQTEEANP